MRNDNLTDEYKTFYDDRRHETYRHDYGFMRTKDHPLHGELVQFIDSFDLADKRCLEIGSSCVFFSSSGFFVTRTDQWPSPAEDYGVNHAKSHFFTAC